jgi:hypothetical protein
MISTIGTLADLVKYEGEHPGNIKNILDGIKSNRLKLCPVESTHAGRKALEEKLQLLYAVKRHKDHCELFLDKSIPRSSRKINRDDMQTLLSGLGGVWSRGKPSKTAAYGKGDAIRVSTSLTFNFF